MERFANKVAAVELLDEDCRSYPLAHVVKVPFHFQISFLSYHLYALLVKIIRVHVYLLLALWDLDLHLPVTAG